MAVTSRLSLPYPALADSADVPRDLMALAQALDNTAPVYLGTFASRPPSSPSQPGLRGRFFIALDITPRALYFDYGTGWEAVNPALVVDGPPEQGTLRSLGIGPQQAISGADGRLSDERNPRPASVDLGKVAAGLRPSQGASNNAEALRPIGEGAGQVLAGAPGAVGPRNLSDELLGAPRIAATWSFYGQSDGTSTGYILPVTGSARDVGASWVTVLAPPLAGMHREFALSHVVFGFPTVGGGLGNLSVWINQIPTVAANVGTTGASATVATRGPWIRFAATDGGAVYLSFLANQTAGYEWRLLSAQLLMRYVRQ